MSPSHKEERKPLHEPVVSLEYGKSRMKLSFVARKVGDDWVAYIVGGKAHVGAVAVGVYDDVSGRASSSVITLAGHRDDRIAKEGAERISERTKTVTVLIAGIHVDNITEKEISTIVKNSEHLIGMFLEKLKD